MNKQNDQFDEVAVRKSSKMSHMIGVLLILVSVAAYVFYSQGLSAEVDTFKTDLSSKNLQIEEMKTQVESYQAAESELDVSTEVQRQESLKAIPVEMAQDEVIRDLVEVTDVYDIGLRSLSFGKGGASEDGVKSLKINSSFEGNYGDLISFLRGIEQNQRIFRVNSISVQLNELNVLDLKRVTFSLSMEAFYQE